MFTTLEVAEAMQLSRPQVVQLLKDPFPDMAAVRCARRPSYWRIPEPALRKYLAVPETGKLPGALDQIAEHAERLAHIRALTRRGCRKSDFDWLGIEHPKPRY